MPRTSNDQGAGKLVWWGMGILATLITTITIILVTGAAGKLSAHSDDITALKVRVDVMSTKIGTLEAKMDRIQNPRRWEQQPQTGRR